ncbi:hypothetical protein [Nitrobacter sp. JJSN]|jgi:hypothetical protein|uniref:hypothetical protein n=1 Tax=Nitrobacter sp. JJSN TaxID=3453033 RepID=UPI003F7578D7
MTIFALACCIVTGVALAGVFGRGNVLFVRFSAAPPASPAPAEAEPAEPTANRAGKADRLPVATLTAAPAVGEDLAVPAPLQQAVTADVPIEPEVLPPTAPIEQPPLPRPRPKLANQLVQKNYSLLSDMQIAALKGRLQLTSAQEPFWPAVESALRDVARKIHERRAVPGRPVAFSPDEIEQIKTAARPLLSRLREDQKREARALARIIGLEAVASLI